MNICMAIVEGVRLTPTQRRIAHAASNTPAAAYLSARPMSPIWPPQPPS